jgi:hypothetical protein
MIIGAPNNAVTALIGSVRFDIVTCDMMSQIIIKMPPDRSVAGITIL